MKKSKNFVLIFFMFFFCNIYAKCQIVCSHQMVNVNSKIFNKIEIRNELMKHVEFFDTIFHIEYNQINADTCFTYGKYDYFIVSLNNNNCSYSYLLIFEYSKFKKSIEIKIDCDIDFSQSYFASIDYYLYPNKISILKKWNIIVKEEIIEKRKLRESIEINYVYPNMR